VGSFRRRGFFCPTRLRQAGHWHAIIFPRSPLTISTVMESIKVSATRLINAGRGERGVLLQGRFFDRALRAVKEYQEKVEPVATTRFRCRGFFLPMLWSYPAG
jgi:hypothetical protein